ncbi:hypothetical protein HPB52_014068 [Rhipicephalus sanguineus]|uniref:Rab-GAP TBC domain-containing protein n=1 Tax=Rhipicephalus sanguineus TaxID=34632 RepID=A0A9D4T2H2_RHISA|nr:hypothetical protein HPB52_014068 [Rhipicephalus sanguineus]
MESSPPDTRPELGTGYEVLDHLQSIWYSKLVECLKDTAKQFGLPLSRKREMLKTPSYEAPLPQDLDSTEYELFAQLIYDTSDQFAAREFLKRGCPHCMRRLFWARVLGISSPEKVNAEFDGLKERVIRHELLVDQIIIKDVRDTVMNDIEYFAFDDSCYQVMLAFTRDYHIARRIRGHSLGTVTLRADLPCGAVPYYGFSLLVEEVLRLWDRVLGYDSVYVLPVAAASLVCSKKTEILGTKDQSSLEDIFNKLQPCDVISTLDEFLKPPDL